MSAVLQVEELKHRAALARIAIIKAGHNKGPLHFASSLSCVELMLTAMNLMAEDDLFFLSKGHASLGRLAVLEALGKLDASWQEQFATNGSPFAVHTSYLPELGIIAPTGSLGLGPSLALGHALGARLQNPHHPAKSCVLCGNGECNEGATYEAFLYAGAHRISNFCVLLDHNHMQLDGASAQVLPVHDYAALFRALGFTVHEVDGHDLHALEQCLRAFYQAEPQAQAEAAPLAIVAHTVRGKGVSFMENALQWHTGALDEQHYVQALSELEQALCEQEQALSKRGGE